MFSKHLKLLSYLFLTIFLTLGLSLSFQFLLAAWAPPTSAPPGGNVSAPLYESSMDQVKLGGLGLGGALTVDGNSSFASNVGIGTTTAPGVKLAIQGTGTYNSVNWGTASDLAIRSSEMTDSAYHSILQLVSIRQSLTTGKDANGYLGFSTIDDSNKQGMLDAGRIAIVNENGGVRNSATALSFWTNPGGVVDTVAATEKVRITSNGDVGIGTANPLAKLDVSTTAYPQIRLNTITNNRSWYLGVNVDNSFILYDSTNAAPRLFIDNSGNIVLGASGAKLEVAGQVKISGGAPGAGKVLTSDTAGLATWQTPTAGVGGSGSANYIPKFTAATTLGNSLIYDNGSNIGIGTNAPNSQLHLYKTSGANAELDIQSVAGANKHWAIYHDRTSNDLRFWNNTPAAGEKNILTITDEGKVSIGGNINNNSIDFAPEVDYGADSNPSSVAIGDLNGDNKADLAVANSNSDNVSILLNNGNGGFAPKVDYRAGNQPYSVAIGDLNGDNKADLAVANSNSDNVSILLNNGNGGFAPKVDYRAGNQPYSVAIGNLNGDNKADLAVANFTSNNVSILLNNGNGGFAPKVDYRTGSFPSSVAIGDLNGDNKADLAVANLASDNVSILLNNGNDGFAPKVDYGVGSNPSSVAIGDLNGDNKADLAVANRSSNNVSILLNNGNGGFAPKVDYRTGSFPSSVAIGDLNGDNKADLAVASFVNIVSIFINQNSSSSLNVNGYIRGVDYYSGDGTAGLTQTINVRKADNSGACAITVKNGLITATTCQ